MPYLNSAERKKSREKIKGKNKLSNSTKVFIKIGQEIIKNKVNSGRVHMH